MRKKEPGVEAARRKWRRDPATNKTEIISVEAQAVMIEQLRPGHTARVKIIEQRSELTDCQCFCAAREQHSDFFKQFPGATTDHSRALRVAAIRDPRFVVESLTLSALNDAMTAE